MRLIGRDLAAERGGRPVFAGVSFALADGELLAVTGANGAGKSTLLRLIAGLLSPAAGAVTLDPMPEGGLAGAIHYVGHADALKPALSVRQNLTFWSRLWGGGTADAALARANLAHLADLPAAALSAGQKRRVALARLNLVRRPLWLLDEPASSLDTEAEGGLMALLSDHLATGGMAIVATHRPLAAEVSATLALGPS